MDEWSRTIMRTTGFLSAIGIGRDRTLSAIFKNWFTAWSLKALARHRRFAMIAWLRRHPRRGYRRWISRLRFSSRTNPSGV